MEERKKEGGSGAIYIFKEYTQNQIISILFTVLWLNLEIWKVTSELIWVKIVKNMHNTLTHSSDFFLFFFYHKTL